MAKVWGAVCHTGARVHSFSLKMVKKKKQHRARKPRGGGNPAAVGGYAIPAWRTASGQSRPDADALPGIQAAMRQIDRLLALMPPETVVQSSGAQDGRELHNWDLVAPAMLFSAANCVLSLRWLAMTPVPRREQDASLLLRRVYEHVVCFAWIAIDPAVNAKRWVAYDYRYRLATDLELQRFGKPGLDPAQRASFEAFRQAHQDMPSLEQRAREADAYWLPKLAQHSDGRSDAERAFSLVDEYTTIYRPTSANTHPSPRSLFDYVNPGFATGRFRIGFIPTLREGDRFAYTFAPLTFATMLFISEQVLGYPKSDDIFAAFHDAAATT